MARVLLLSLVFAPDGVSGAQLFSELVTDIDDAGHRVSVVTTQPHYSRDVVAEAAQPLRSRWAGWFYQSEFRGIPVLHARMGRKRGGIAHPMWGWLGFHVFSLFAGLFLVERPDVVLVPSPLLTAGVVGWCIVRIRGAVFV